VNPGTSCSDNNKCNGLETCSAQAVCTAGSPLITDDANPCTVDKCDAATGSITHTLIPGCVTCANAAPCDDMNPCTVDTCSGGTCAHSNAAAATACPDATKCNGDEKCDGLGACKPGTPVMIDDANGCTTDKCDAATGSVSHTMITGCVPCASAGECDDNNACSLDMCTAGACAHAPAPVDTPCPDTTKCNGDEKCDAAGVCKAGTAIVVDDGKPCTTDVCDPATGNVTHPNAAAGTPCPDANKCNGDEACDAGGMCKAGTAIVVDDGKVCTTDACDPATGNVTHTPVAMGMSCADALKCNGDETCDAAGVCQAGTAVSCPASCVSAMFSAPMCTEPGGACVGAAMPCAGHFACATASACGTTCTANSVTGCAASHFCDGAGTSCLPLLAPGAVCTLGLTCASGSCLPAASGKVCSAMGVTMCANCKVLDNTGQCTLDLVCPNPLTCDMATGACI
jgi:hypothetical protein